MAIILNGVTYNGVGGNPQPPDADGGVDRRTRQIARVLVAANGSRSKVHRGGAVTQKNDWTLTWSNANTTTRTALLNLMAVGTSFSFTDDQGGVWTVQTEEEALTISSAFVKSNNTMLYNMSLDLHEV